jgi:hypothetical protein
MKQDPLQVFNPEPFYPGLGLIRIPYKPAVTSTAPAARDWFGTGFFVTKDGVLVTVAHNLTEDGEPAGKPLPWVWVCGYNPADRDWTNIKCLIWVSCG